MAILILGGTSWLGGHVAHAGLRAGHEVTCLARGESGDTPVGSRLVRADRTAPDAYAVLPASQRWDLVVDVTRQPGQARSALAALSERAAHWAFVSSGSVYADHSQPGGDRSTPLLPAFDGDVAGLEAYGEAKVACEAACTAYRGEDVLLARSGLIAGAGDRSDRFGYWVSRFALAAQDGGPVLVPESIAQPAQLADVLDLAAWLVRAGLDGTTGIVDAYGPRRTLRDVVDTAREVAGFTGATVVAGDEQLGAAAVEEFMGPHSLALWLRDPAWLGFSSRDTASAEAAGFVTRDLAATTRDALGWERELGLDRTGRRAGLDRADELAVIAGLA